MFVAWMRGSPAPTPSPMAWPGAWPTASRMARPAQVAAAMAVTQQAVVSEKIPDNRTRGMLRCLAESRHRRRLPLLRSPRGSVLIGSCQRASSQTVIVASLRRSSDWCHDDMCPCSGSGSLRWRSWPRTTSSHLTDALARSGFVSAQPPSRTSAWTAQGKAHRSVPLGNREQHWHRRAPLARTPQKCRHRHQRVQAFLGKALAASATCSCPPSGSGLRSSSAAVRGNWSFIRRMAGSGYRC
mmetsp:Transcript_60763/g.114592  ORF Transcript_60763/g.114592 Transcript_60763/m.114592 type:complete len:241 (+) Transcript_60763:70-792(+)